jgi:hypothetical protein
MLRKIYVVDDELHHAKLLAANLTQPGRLHIEVFEKTSGPAPAS